MENLLFTPRVDSATLPSQTNKTVKLVGNVLNISGNQMILETCDKGQVKVILQNDSKCFTAQGMTVEVLGKVEVTGQVTELVSDVLPGNYDPDLYQNVIRIMKEYPAIYGQ